VKSVFVVFFAGVQWCVWWRSVVHPLRRRQART
jgi:hypothetical protein